jgi:hypothetical protein
MRYLSESTMEDDTGTRRGDWFYTAPPAPANKSLLLTDQGICIIGSWSSVLNVIAWAPLPKRDKKLEEAIQEEEATASARGGEKWI